MLGVTLAQAVQGAGAAVGVCLLQVRVIAVAAAWRGDEALEVICLAWGACGAVDPAGQPDCCFSMQPAGAKS